MPTYPLSKNIWRDLLLLFIVALVVRVITALPQQEPGYFDATYYYVNAVNLAQGRGFVEDFVWNYLDNPARPPHPGNLYWMPLTSIVAVPGLLIGGESFRAAQAPFIILSALLASITYWAAFALSSQRRLGWLAGLLTVFSGFYLPYWTTTDNFTVFAVVGSLAFLFAWRGVQGSGVRDQGSEFGVQSSEFRVRSSGFGVRNSLFSILAGVFAGLAHLTRADGLLILIAILLAAWIYLVRQMANRKSQIANLKSKITQYAIRTTLLVLLGYFLIMTPWFLRNWQVADTPLPAAGSQTIWLTTYDDLFSYGRELSPQSFFAQGWGNILQGRLWALSTNLQTAIAVWGMIFLTPLVLVGGWHLRRHFLVQMVGLYALLLFVTMTLIFAFPGARGGLFHSGAALLPFIYALAVIGLDVAVEWVAARRRHWKAGTAKQVFGVGLVVFAVLLSGFVYYGRVIKGNAWNNTDPHYPDVVLWVAQQDPTATVMIGNPVAYQYYGGGLSVVVPNETLGPTLDAARNYQVKYLILDRNRPLPLTDVYQNPTASPQLELVKSFGQDTEQPVYIWRVAE